MDRWVEAVETAILLTVMEVSLWAIVRLRLAAEVANTHAGEGDNGMRCDAEKEEQIDGNPAGTVDIARCVLFL